MARVSSQKLKKAVQAIAPLAQGRYPILSFVILEADKDQQKLFVTATDLESRIRVGIPASVDTPFKALVYNRTLRNILNDEETKLTLENGSLVVANICEQHILPTASLLDYPDPPELKNIEWGCTFSLSPPLPNLLSLTSKKAHTGNGRSLNGIFFEIEDGQLHAWVTDGAALGHTKFIDIESSNSGWCFIPAQAFKAFASVIAKNAPITMRLFSLDVDEFAVQLESNGTVLCVEQDHRDILNFRGVYPQGEWEARAQLQHTGDLAKFFKELPASTESVNVTFQSGNIVVIYRNGNVTEVKAQFPAEVESKGEIGGKYNVQRLKKIANLLSDPAEICMYDTEKPMLFKGFEADFLLMPMRG